MSPTIMNNEIYLRERCNELLRKLEKLTNKGITLNEVDGDSLVAKLETLKAMLKKQKNDSSKTEEIQKKEIVLSRIQEEFNANNPKGRIKRQIVCN